MDCFPKVFLPYDLLVFLKNKDYVDNESLKEVFRSLVRHNGHYGNSLQFFSEFDQELRFDEIIRSLGWAGFRNRLTSIYVSYAIHGTYPSGPDLTLIQDVIDLEERLDKFTSVNLSKSFLFGLFCKLVKIRTAKNKGNFQQSDFHFGLIPEEILTLFSEIQCKSGRIDWFALAIWSFSEMLGFEQTRDMIKFDKKKYKDLYLSLSPSQTRVFGHNMLTYGYAISEPNIFSNSMKLKD